MAERDNTDVNDDVPEDDKGNSKEDNTDVNDDVPEDDKGNSKEDNTDVNDDVPEDDKGNSKEEDIVDKIDEALEILLDGVPENGQGKSSKQKMRLKNEDGSINEAAREKVVSIIMAVRENIKHINAASGNNLRAMQSFKTSMKTDSGGQYKEGWGIRGKKRNANIYIPNPTSVTNTITADFRILFEKIDVGCKIMHATSQLRDDAPLIVVCPNVSRLEPDVDHALTGLEWPVRFAVIVLNMTRESSLPRLPIETRFNTEQKKYSNIDFIDVAFTPEDHLYDCNMNTEAKTKLRAFFDLMYYKKSNLPFC